MYFKELEVCGFKSFQNKTKFTFQPGVTAIVGPNGCGKSNVVDAIKWVLGDQSTRSMRSENMSEVIFNGTEKHEPLNVAEVSLTLSNEDRCLPVDYDEVIIGRRLYRNGESEYLLNKVPVRLADIRQLTMGTGIGTSSYSVVEQGKMDVMISAKPEARRHIFEEASGITRYKTKKHQAQLKLERTRENLTRINDIISEVERQIRSIERKARKAERYRTLFEELKELDLKLSRKKYDELQSSEGSLGETGTGLSAEADTLKAHLEASYGKLQELKGRLKDAVSRVHSIQQEKLHLESEVAKNRDFVQLYTERVKELENEVERLSGELVSDNEEAERLRGHVELAEQQLSAVRSSREDRQEKLRAMQDKVRQVTEATQKARHDLNMGRERVVDISSRRSQLENLMVKIDTDMRNCTARKRRLSADHRDAGENLSEVKGTLAEVDREMTSVSRELEGLSGQYDDIRKGCEEAFAEAGALRTRREDKEKELNRIRPRREFLENLIAQREGIKGPVKQVIELAEKGEEPFVGVLGIVSELISVEPGYDEALESVLGDVSQAVVVDKASTADRVCEFLAGRELESVSFLVIEELEKRSQKSRGGIVEGTLDDITQIFSAAEPFASALRTYLADTFVTVSPEVARLHVDSADDFRGRIICEHGEVLEKGSRRSRNYSSEETISILGRREKMKKLMQKEEELTASISELSGMISDKDAWIEKARQEKEELERVLRTVERRHADISSRKGALEGKLLSLEEELTVIEAEMGEMAEQLTILNEKKDQTAMTIKGIDSESAEMKNKLENAQRDITEFDKKRERYVFELADMKAEFSSLSKEEENLAYNLERDSSALERAESSISLKRDRISESSERVVTLKGRIEGLLEQIDLQQTTLSEKSGELESAVTGRDTLETELAELEERVREDELKLQQAQDSTHEVDMRKKEIEYKKRAVAEHVRNSYRTDIFSLESDSVGDIDQEEAELRVGRLRERIESMGSVSLEAVDEQEELKGRYDFLTKQRDDLVESKNAILKAIREINMTTRKLFMETFERIREEFNTYFRMLFNGGKAELVLQDTDDVLECGIDINVRPPGKKLHNVMQLSGGEKAMTAIALIFAIFKVNPSPFCVLDEIDAPLDESNIVRFTRVLREFLKLSQFIVITHNRLTIQLADILYGVTMQEEGVSKVVSVKFREGEESEEAEKVSVMS